MEFRFDRKSIPVLMLLAMATIAGIVSFTPAFAATNGTSTASTASQSTTSGSQSTTTPMHKCPNMGSNVSSSTSSSTTSGTATA